MKTDKDVDVSMRNFWRRFVIGAIGGGVIAGIWLLAVHHLYFLPKESYGAFATITSVMFGTVGGTVIFAVIGAKPPTPPGMPPTPL
jgi:hypothetical protein